MMSNAPLVFAHRGSSAAAPEHTREAYQLALSDGADGLECDVRLTRDGHLVCLHDRRVERTSDGRGVVSRSTLGELRELDFGSRRSAAGRSARARLGRSWVLTLDQLLELAAGAGRQIELLVETKHPTRFGGRVEAALCATLRRHGLAHQTPDSPVRVTVMSFSMLAVRRIHRATPMLPTALLMDVVPPGMRGGGLPFGVPVAGPSIRLLRAHPELVGRLRARGRRLYVWTVNDPEDLDLVVDLGIDGVISDRPAEVISRLRARGLRA